MSRLTVVAILGSALLHGGAFLVTAQDAKLPSAKTPGERPFGTRCKTTSQKIRPPSCVITLSWRLLEDIIWPENPEFRYRRGRKDEILEVVLGDKTLAANDLTELDLQLDRPSQNIAGKDPRSVPVDTQADFNNAAVRHARSPWRISGRQIAVSVWKMLKSYIGARMGISRASLRILQLRLNSW